MRVETESPTQDTCHSQEHSVPHKRAFVVEDEPAMCVLIQEVLQAAGIDAVTVTNRAEANGRFQTEKFDVVFIGLGAQSEEGNDLVRQIRDAGFNKMTPIIMISQDQRPDALSRGFQAGVSFFVYKPIERARLVSLIHATQGTIEQAIRRFRRVRVQAKVRLKCGEVELLGETVDLSLNGALVRAPGSVPVGSRVEMSLYLPPEAAPVIGSASVKRISDDNQMGILFDHLQPVDSGRLQEYLLPKIAG